MHPTLVREPFHRAGWVYEGKDDGWRMLAYKDGGAVRLVYRRGVTAEVQYSETMQGRLRDPVLRSVHAVSIRQAARFETKH